MNRGTQEEKALTEIQDMQVRVIQQIFSLADSGLCLLVKGTGSSEQVKLVFHQTRALSTSTAWAYARDLDLRPLTVGWVVTMKVTEVSVEETVETSPDVEQALVHNWNTHDEYNKVFWKIGSRIVNGFHLFI